MPNSVLDILENQKIKFNITKVDDNKERLALVHPAPDVCVVKSLILQDSRGRVQVLIPDGALLDLDAMIRHFGRQFEAVPVEELRPIVQAQELVGVPAIPRWQGMETIVETSLLKESRLMLESGHAGHMLEIDSEDFHTIVGSAERGHFTSPCPKLVVDPENDAARITSSVDRFTNRRIRKRLEETLELPPLPETAQRIIKLRADPEADISDLTEIVEIDPSLAAQVVSWAGSPYYSAPGKIKSVHDAIVRVLGFDMVLNLALGLSLGKSLTMSALTKKDVEDYWSGAVYTAAAVESLIAIIDRKYRPGFGMAYLSGLLNNFGFLVLAEVFPPYATNIKRLSIANPHIPSAAVEKYSIGLTGTQIAGWLLEDWSMPIEVVTAVRYKDDPSYEGEEHAYAKVVYLAQHLLANHGHGDKYASEIPEHVFKSLHLDRRKADDVILNMLESAEDLDTLAANMRG